MRFINTALATSMAFVIAACASVSSPEGGPRDTTPPTLVKSNPSDQELNVQTKTVRLEFNEFVQPLNLQKELLITPFTENKYKIKVDEEVMELTFEKPFEDSTTYTFNFRNGIADITEKNVVKGLKLSFSTGTYIDTSRIAGEVLNLMTQQLEQDAIVALYPAEDTTNIRKSRPYYQAQTNTSGQFSFENVKEGKYRIYALKDKNNNGLYDNEGERIGFLKEPVTIKADTQKVKLQTFIIDTKKPIALQRQKLADRYTITYSEGLEKINAVSAERKDTIASKILTDGKTVELYRSSNFNGGKALVTAVDSAGNSALDTIQVDFGQDYTQRVQGAAIKLINKNVGNPTYKPGQKITLELQGQVRINGTTPVTIQTDSTSGLKLNYPEQVILDKTGTELSFTIPKLPVRQQPYQVVLDSTQVIPLQNKPLKFSPINITISEGQGTGSVKGTINTTANSFVIQLLDGKYNVVKQIRNIRNFTFREIEPGIYQLRVLVDENNNGKWDRGSGDFSKEPERVYLFPQQIEVRANWELEDIKIQL